MISLVLVDAELERIPGHCPAHSMPRVCGVEKGDLEQVLVLDSYIHRHILEGLESGSRRGRPDIVHSFLLLAQDSRPRREGWLRSYVHTRADEVIQVGPEFMPERNYMSFLAQVSELLSQGTWGEGEKGMSLRENLTLTDLLKELNPDLCVALSPHGDCKEPKKALRGAKEKHLAILIGGFPEGDYRSPVYQLADVVLSLGEELLTVPDVTSQVLKALP
ncbi:MAG: hypothetical protein QW520_04570 [Methanomassiliicoccales archaeon]